VAYMSALVHNGDCAFSPPQRRHRHLRPGGLPSRTRDPSPLLRRGRCVPRGDRQQASHQLKELIVQQPSARVRMTNTFITLKYLIVIGLLYYILLNAIVYLNNIYFILYLFALCLIHLYVNY